MTYRYKFQREMARQQRRYHFQRVVYRAVAASAVLVAFGLVVL
jgi:hypothetical protein